MLCDHSGGDACGTVSLFKLDLTYRFKVAAEQLLRPTAAAEQAQHEDPFSSYVDDFLIAGLKEVGTSAIPELGLERNLFGILRINGNFFPPQPLLAAAGKIITHAINDAENGR